MVTGTLTQPGLFIDYLLVCQCCQYETIDGCLLHSGMNTAQRYSMSEVVLQDLMTICVDVPVLEDFDATESSNLWLSENSGMRRLDGHRAKWSWLGVTSVSEPPSKVTLTDWCDMVLFTQLFVAKFEKNVFTHEMSLFCFQFLIYQAPNVKTTYINCWANRMPSLVAQWAPCNLKSHLASPVDSGQSCWGMAKDWLCLWQDANL